jgi:hypothetical protein
MARRPDFQALQEAIAAHIRNPETTPAPADIEDRRIGIYRELFFNNISQFLAGTFPVLHRILGTADWRALVRDFFAQHRSQSPYFLEIPSEFLSYLQQERGQGEQDPPFLLELAHYEWVELALSVDTTDPDMSQIDVAGDLLLGAPVLSPLAWRLSYHYPVHRIGPDFLPREPLRDPVHLVVCRDLHDKVSFTEINLLTAKLMELIETSPEASGCEILERIAGELGSRDPTNIIQAGGEALLQLKQADIILGTRRP